MTTDLMDRKINHVVALCDSNGDGVVEVSDFVTWVERLAAIRGWAPGTGGHRELERLYVDGAKGVIALVGDEDRLSVRAFGDAMRSLSAEDLARFAAEFFRLIDADGDGEIGPDEYADLLASLGIDRAGADAAFSKLDLNGDGHISGDEFSQLYLEFFRSEDPDAPGNWFWGPF